MLSDAEQRRLSEIEAQLRSDDPAFVEGFEKGERGGPRSVWRQLATLVGGGLAVLFCGMGLAFGSVGAVVVALTALGAAIGLWVVQRRRL